MDRILAFIVVAGLALSGMVLPLSGIVLPSPIAADEAPADAEPSPPLLACTGGYALCTSAPCEPMADDPTMSLCACEIVYGANVANVPCEERQMGSKAISAYSYAQVAALRLNSCAGDIPFADCLNAKCKADPDNPMRAKCACPIVPGQEGAAAWGTFGGGCDPGKCDAVIWSGAFAADIAGANCVLDDYMGLCDSTNGVTCDLANNSCTGPYTTCGG